MLKGGVRRAYEEGRSTGLQGLRHGRRDVWASCVGDRMCGPLGGLWKPRTALHALGPWKLTGSRRAELAAPEGPGGCSVPVAAFALPVGRIVNVARRALLNASVYLTIDCPKLKGQHADEAERSQDDRGDDSEADRPELHRASLARDAPTRATVAADTKRPRRVTGEA